MRDREIERRRKKKLRETERCGERGTERETEKRKGLGER